MWDSKAEPLADWAGRQTAAMVQDGMLVEMAEAIPQDPPLITTDTIAAILLDLLELPTLVNALREGSPDYDQCLQALIRAGYAEGDATSMADVLYLIGKIA